MKISRIEGIYSEYSQDVSKLEFKFNKFNQQLKEHILQFYKIDQVDSDTQIENVVASILENTPLAKIQICMADEGSMIDLIRKNTILQKQQQPRRAKTQQPQPTEWDPSQTIKITKEGNALSFVTYARNQLQLLGRVTLIGSGNAISKVIKVAEQIKQKTYTYSQITEIGHNLVDANEFGTIPKAAITIHLSQDTQNISHYGYQVDQQSRREMGSNQGRGGRGFRGGRGMSERRDMRTRGLGSRGMPEVGLGSGRGMFYRDIVDLRGRGGRGMPYREIGDLRGRGGRGMLYRDIVDLRGRGGRGMLYRDIVDQRGRGGRGMPDREMGDRRGRGGRGMPDREMGDQRGRGGRGMPDREMGDRRGRGGRGMPYRGMANRGGRGSRGMLLEAGQGRDRERFDRDMGDQRGRGGRGMPEGGRVDRGMHRGGFIQRTLSVEDYLEQSMSQSLSGRNLRERPSVSVSNWGQPIPIQMLGIPYAVREDFRGRVQYKPHGIARKPRLHQSNDQMQQEEQFEMPAEDFGTVEFQSQREGTRRPINQRLPVRGGRIFRGTHNYSWYPEEQIPMQVQRPQNKSPLWDDAIEEESDNPNQ